MSGISFQQKEGSSKKERREQRLKRKRGKISYEELHVQKKRMNFTSCWERFYQKKERKKGDHIFL
jgi:hypothetical protein